MPRKFAIPTVMVILIVGCAQQIQRPMRICPGKRTIGKSLSTLRLRSEDAVPFKANGQCLLQYHVDGKQYKENFPVKLWVNPPAQIYMQGDVAFNPKGIVVGSNKREFWLSMKPKEISTYIWGQWSEASCPDKLIINPQLVLEALGITAVGDEANWSLSREGGFDVLTRRGGGAKQKKISIDSCDYLVRRIDYFDDNGEATVVMELGKYANVSDGFSVPRVVKIVRRSEDGGQDSVRIKLNSIKSANFSEKLVNRLFTRPEPRGFEHVYKIIDGELIEQP